MILIYVLLFCAVAYAVWVAMFFFGIVRLAIFDPARRALATFTIVVALVILWAWLR
jgi:hypothetical protein